jgi:glycosyltransferase involved in cell wall biosynthesis
MKIVYITLENMSSHKGSVVHIKEVILGLRKLGHHVTLIAPALGKIENADSFYNVYPDAINLIKFLGLKKKSYFISLVALFLYLLKVIPQSEVIYAREFYGVLVALLPRLLFRKKLVFEINGLASEEQKLRGDSFKNTIFSFLIKQGEVFATKCSNLMVPVTPQISTYLINHFHRKPHMIKVVQNGVNVRSFNPINDIALLRKWRKKVGIEEDEAVVVFVGNIAPWQGVNVLIESAFQLLPKNEKLKFLIVGDGFLKSLLMKKVEDSEWREKIIFLGTMPYEEIPFLINIADICVAPFINERNRKTGVSPLKVFEYMACGKPVVSSRIEGLEFIEKECAGQLVEPDDAISLAKALEDLLRSANKRIEMGRRGLEIAGEKFSWDSRVVEISEILSAM